MADWQMREKRPLRGPRPEPAGPTLKNYITPAGLQRLKDEHVFLLSRERPAVVEVVAWAASNGDRSENADYHYGKRRLGQIDSRIRFLTKRIDAAVVVDPGAPRPGAAATRVFFGATVTYKDAAGLEHVVSIVGIDEVDLDRGYISWRSPLANALMKACPGDRVNLICASEDGAPRDHRGRVRADSYGSVPRTAGSSVDPQGRALLDQTARL